VVAAPAGSGSDWCGEAGLGVAGSKNRFARSNPGARGVWGAPAEAPTNKGSMTSIRGFMAIRRQAGGAVAWPLAARAQRHGCPPHRTHRGFKFISMSTSTRLSPAAATLDLFRCLHRPRPTRRAFTAIRRASALPRAQRSPRRRGPPSALATAPATRTSFGRRLWHRLSSRRSG
jgi:hypothetical protein